MKTIQRIRIPQRWKTVSVIGFGLSATGLVGAVLLISQLIPSIFDGELPEVSSVVLALEATISLIMIVTGFALMVAGADPFEDVSDEFSFIVEDQEWTLHDAEMETSTAELTRV